MTNRLQEQWIAGAVGRAINPDNAYGLQCVDVADDYAEAIFPGLSWAQTIGGVNGAREFHGRTNSYFQWIDNVVGDVSSVPARGDLVIFNGSRLNPYGHVAVVLSANANTITVIQQDGFLQTPAAVGVLPYDGPGTGPCLGWLRPKVSPDPAAAPPAPGTAVRVTGPAGVKERLEPTINAGQDRIFGGDLELTMKGYVHATGPGSDPYGDGNDVWYVGISGKYFHSSGFVGGADGTGLPDLTPKAASPVPELAPTQRIVGAAGASKRAQPDKNAELLETFAPGDVLNFTGYVRASRPYGAGSSDVWFLGTSGAYIYSGAVEGGDNVGSLPDRTAPFAPEPPAPVEAYNFTSQWKSVTRVAPAALANFQRGNFPARPTHLVVHQMDDPSRHPTLEGTADYFHTPRPDRPTSAHMGASEGELWEFVQTLKDRAYHAGTIGNNYLSVEVPPNPSAKTIETVKRFQREFRDTMGYELRLTRHKDVPGNATACGTHIPLEAFSIAGELVPAPTPAPAPAPTPPPADGTIAEFLQWCVTQILAAWRARK